MIRGIDVSHYQGAVDWKALKASYGLSFGAAKCTEGTGFTDSEFLHNWAGMKSAGLSRIAYHYARPEQSNAAAQALRLVNIAQPKAGDAVCLDLEASALSQAQTNAWMRAFGQALRSLAPGVTTIAYLGGYAANGSGQGAVDAFDRWWYPRYASTGLTKSWPSTFAPHLSGNTTGWQAPPAPHIWQFSPNLNGRDANVSDLTLASLFGGSGLDSLEEIMAWYDNKQDFEDSIAHAVQAYDQGGATPQAWAFLQKAAHATDLVAALPASLSADAIADAIVAKLPAGALTKADVAAALRDVLVGGTAAVPA